MEKIFQVDWNSVFVPSTSLLEIFIRGTIMYLVMFALLRIFRRQAGSVGIADLLVIVVIADAAQNGMAGESKSVSESILLILTIVLWDYLLDWLGDKSDFFKRIVEPRELMLIVDGKLLRHNMKKEMISYDELMSQLRQQGVEEISEVKICYLESNGRFSVLTKDKHSDKPRGKLPSIKFMKNKQRKLSFFNLFLGMQKDLIVGGQAVMEGVMMRTPNAYAIACRKSDGTIVRTGEFLPKWSDKYKWLNLPVLRGGATLIQSMALGVKALNFSASVAHEDMEEQEAKEKTAQNETQAALVEGTLDENFTKAPAKVTLPEKSEKKKAGQAAGAVGSIIFALFFNVMLFIVAPLVLTNILFIGLGWAETPAAADASWWQAAMAYSWKIKLDSFSGWVGFNLIDGLIRMVFFVLMIFSMSYLRDIRRVFEYHGAEHKTVFTWEKELNLTVDNARPQIRQHPRCGTSFLMVVMLVAIVLFSVINFEAMWLNLLVRISLMPLVAGLSYEIIRYAAKKESSAVFKAMTLPGLWLQNITTQEPDDSQLEVAIEALKESLKLEPIDDVVAERELEVVV